MVFIICFRMLFWVVLIAGVDFGFVCWFVVVEVICECGGATCLLGVFFRLYLFLVI